MRLLLVEDDAQSGECLAKGLEERGFAVDSARDSAQALERALSTRYDLIILDVGPCGIDGWAVLREIRKSGKTPVIFLSPHDRVEDRVRGLELGAQDYLVKPYAFPELLARVHAILRRGRPVEREISRIGDLEVDILNRRVERGRRRIELTVKEYELLLLFLRCKGELLSRRRIAQEIWNVSDDGDHGAVDVAVRRLRAKIDDPFAAKLIQTVRGFGYTRGDPIA